MLTFKIHDIHIKYFNSHSFDFALPFYWDNLNLKNMLNNIREGSDTGT